MINRTKTLAAILTAGILSLNAFAVPDNTATQTVTFEVSPINQISVSSPTVSLMVNAAAAGSAPTSATDSSTTYAVTTNESYRKITGSINTAMPTGVTLSVALAAVTGATSAGSVALGTSAVDLVYGFDALNESGKTISYTLAATSAAGVVPSASKTVTFTLTAQD